jgi:AraC-like DNA-binding protein
LNRVVRLVETPLVRVTRFEHPENEPHRDPREESADSVSLSFVVSGSFSVRAGSRSHEVTPKSLFVTHPGLSYRTAHAETCPTDVCLSFDYRPGFFDGEARPAAPPFPVLDLSNRTGYLKWRLLRALEESPRGALLEEIGVELADAAFGAENDERLFRERSLSWYAERVEAARTRMEESFHERHSLSSLSRTAGMSAFHFARIFRSLVGTPPGRYLLLVRLERARGLLRQGRSVTDASFDCGFRNLSYFTRAFRKRYGSLPSAIRAK